MRLREIKDVEIITQGGSVRGVVVVAEDGELLSDASGSLGNVREEVLRFPLREFPNESRGVGADGIEVAQRDG